jgi:hypothetical protein
MKTRIMLAVVGILISAAGHAATRDAEPNKEAAPPAEYIKFLLADCHSETLLEVAVERAALPSEEAYFAVVDDMPMTDIPVCFGAPAAGECCKTVTYNAGGQATGALYTTGCEPDLVWADMTTSE